MVYLTWSCCDLELWPFDLKNNSLSLFQNATDKATDKCTLQIFWKHHPKLISDRQHNALNSGGIITINTEYKSAHFHDYVEDLISVYLPLINMTKNRTNRRRLERVSLWQINSDFPNATLVRCWNITHNTIKKNFSRKAENATNTKVLSLFISFFLITQYDNVIVICTQKISM